MKLQASQIHRIVLKKGCQSCPIGKLGQGLPTRHLELCNTISFFLGKFRHIGYCSFWRKSELPIKPRLFSAVQKPYEIELICLMW